MTPPKLERPTAVHGVTYEEETGCGPLFVTINDVEGQPIELFCTMGKAGGCASSQAEALGRAVSLAFKYHLPPDEFIKQFVGISCHQPKHGGALSCADGVARALRTHLKLD